MPDITYYAKCICGAVTIEVDGMTYSCRRENLRIYFPDIDLRRLRKQRCATQYCCDWCVNHYGLDLCSCGSGNPVERCGCGSHKPMQKLGEYTHYRADDALCI